MAVHEPKDGDTDERLAQVASRLGQDPFRRFVEESSDLFTVVDLEGRFLYVSPAARAVFGLPPEQCLGRSAFDFVHPDDRERTRHAFRAWMRQPGGESHSIENRQVSLTGEVRDCLWTIRPVLEVAEGEPYVVSSARDITALRGFERRLAQSEARHRAVLAGLLDPLVTIDARGTIQDASDSVLAVFGYRREELVGRNVSLLMGEPYRSEHDGYLDAYRRTGRASILNRTRAFEVRHRDGHMLPCELSVSRIEVPGRKEPLFCGSFRDVGARVQTERALRESERRFRAIFDQEFQSVGLLRPDGTLVEVNQTALERTGSERLDVIGKPFWETPWWRRSEVSVEKIKGAVRRAAAGEFVRFEVDVRARDGELRTFDFSLKPIRSEEGGVVLLLPEGRDITELKNAQRRETAMLRALASIGESAAVLAHEIKSPITAVNLALRAVADQLGTEHQSVLEDLVTRMERLRGLMKRTLSLARPLEMERVACDVERVFREALDLLAEELASAGVSAEVEVDPACPPAHADPGLLGEVVVNLVRNALQACGPGARVALRAGPGPFGRVCLSVEDDGPGIPAEVLPTLFNPFVTTRADGTGLGLAVCRKIVEEHGGTIAADGSALGGARIAFDLPAVG